MGASESPEIVERFTGGRGENLELKLGGGCVNGRQTERESESESDITATILVSFSLAKLSPDFANITHPA